MRKFIKFDKGLTYDDSERIGSSIRECIEKVNRSENPIRSGSTVAVKVNITGPYGPGTAACTHPLIVKSAVSQLKRAGARVKIVEDCYEEDAPEISGILGVARETGVEFVNLKNTKYKEVTVRGNKYFYYEEIYNADHLVLLPKLKTHVLTNYSGAIKLMYGSIIKRQRISCHKNIEPADFANILTDIFSIKLPTLAIMDGILSMDGAGPTHGTPNDSGIMLISNDAVLLDYYASRLMGYRPLEIDMIKTAFLRKLTSDAPEDIEMSGDRMDEYDHGFKIIPVFKGKMRRRYMKLAVGVPQFRKERCTLCEVCIKSCPFAAIHIKDGYPSIDASKCRQCFCCMELCKNEAMVLKAEC